MFLHSVELLRSLRFVVQNRRRTQAPSLAARSRVFLTPHAVNMGHAKAVSPYMQPSDVDPLPEARFRCPCCGFRTLEAPAAMALCPVCWWEDDGQEDDD